MITVSVMRQVSFALGDVIVAVGAVSTGADGGEVLHPVSKKITTRNEAEEKVQNQQWFFIVVFLSKDCQFPGRGPKLGGVFL
jgi:hypothetical protein